MWRDVHLGVIPLEVQKSMNSLDFNSPLSILSIPTFCPVWRSTTGTQILSAVVAEDFSGRGIAQEYSCGHPKSAYFGDPFLPVQNSSGYLSECGISFLASL